MPGQGCCRACGSFNHPPHIPRSCPSTAFLSIDYPHVLPMQRIYESDRSVFLVRQYLFANLAQRISTRPFLTAIEKVRVTARGHGLQDWVSSAEPSFS